jgi:hypothetical protein
LGWRALFLSKKMERKDMIKSFLKFKEGTSGKKYTKEMIFKMCRENNIDLNISNIPKENYPKDVFGDELEKYQFLRD